MDAIEFRNEFARMCASYGSCAECAMPKGIRECAFLPTKYTTEKTSDIVKIVEEWSDAHPRKTRQDVFLEQWPNAKVCMDGVLDFCPMELDVNYSCKSTDIEMRCQSCRREFWGQEVE